jgi:hypothetical protein
MAAMKLAVEETSKLRLVRQWRSRSSGSHPRIVPVPNRARLSFEAKAS